MNPYCLSGALADGFFGSDEGGEDIGTADEAICPGKTTVRGVDVSYYQGNVNWAAAKKSGIRFAFSSAKCPPAEWPRSAIRSRSSG